MLCDHASADHVSVSRIETPSVLLRKFNPHCRDMTHSDVAVIPAPVSQRPTGCSIKSLNQSVCVCVCCTVAAPQNFGCGAKHLKTQQPQSLNHGTQCVPRAEVICGHSTVLLSTLTMPQPLPPTIFGGKCKKCVLHVYVSVLRCRTTI